jgi:penicillin-binding protein 1A
MDSVRNVATTIQCGVVVIDAKTGAILALVGSSPKSMHDNIESDYSLNHVTQIKRQPGSSMKPFVYASALTNGYNPESMIECGPFSYMLSDSTFWSPSGTGSCEKGDKRTLQSALQWSINTVSARLITSATNPDEVIHLCRNIFE